MAGTEAEAGTVAAAYTRLEQDRQPFLDRARRAAELTIPSLLPPEGHANGASLYEPKQSVGASGLNNMSSQLLLTLLPPNTPFWRHDLDPKAARELEEDPEQKTAVDEAMARYDRTALKAIEAHGDRVHISEAFKHLINDGNALLNTEAEGARVFSLDRYVVQRDPMGRTYRIIVKESYHYETLPEEAMKMVSGDAENSTPDKTIDIYTEIVRNPNSKAPKGKYWLIKQEIEGQMIPGSDGSYTDDAMPWLPLRLHKIDGEAYGRGYIEEYMGDLSALDTLSRALVEGSAAMAKVLFLVAPNGSTKITNLSKKPNGAFVPGREEDVGTLKVDKNADFSTILAAVQRIEGRLDMVFLNHSAVQRDAERVTAEEIRYIAQQLENALGGVYSVLAQEFQRPYIKLKLEQLHRTEKLPKMPKQWTQITIVTGLEALGRGHDRAKLVRFIGTLVELAGPELLQKFVNLTELIKRLATADGIDLEGLMKSEDQMAQDAQMQQLMQMVQDLGPEALKQMGAAAQQEQGVNNGASQAG